MHYLGAVTSQSHTVYYIRFVMFVCFAVHRDPITVYDKNLQCSRLHVQICVIVFSLDKSQTPYSAGICVSSHLTVFLSTQREC